MGHYQIDCTVRDPLVASFTFLLGAVLKSFERESCQISCSLASSPSRMHFAKGIAWLCVWDEGFQFRELYELNILFQRF